MAKRDIIEGTCAGGEPTVSRHDMHHAPEDQAPRRNAGGRGVFASGRDGQGTPDSTAPCLIEDSMQSTDPRNRQFSQKCRRCRKGMTIRAGSSMEGL